MGEPVAAARRQNQESEEAGTKLEPASRPTFVRRASTSAVASGQLVASLKRHERRTRDAGWDDDALDQRSETVRIDEGQSYVYSRSPKNPALHPTQIRTVQHFHNLRSDDSLLLLRGLVTIG